METGRRLSIGWKVMAGWGILNIFFAILVPVSSHLSFPGMGFALGSEDEKFIGTSWQQIVSFDPDLAFWIVLMMDSMCAMMIGFGILMVGIAWTAYRRGERWAWRTLVAANVMNFLYGAGLTLFYASRGLYGFNSGVSVGVVFLVVWIVVLIVGLGLPRRELAQG